MSVHSRRQFMTRTGCLVGGTLAARAASGEARMPSVDARTQPAARPALSLICANYIRFMPIAAGDVRPADLDLTWVRADRSEALRRAIDDVAIDGGESSMARHVMRVDQGDRSLVAVPVFPLRNFTARDLYTTRRSPVTTDALAGRRVGIYNWAASGAVWYRHLVRYLGHDVTGITWVVGGVDAPADVRVPEPAPAHVSLAPKGRALSELLVAGEIDAIFAPLPPRQSLPIDGPIVRVREDFRTLEQQYFATTRCYPPQHVILVKRAAWERETSVGRRLVQACNENDAIFEAAQRRYPYNSPWLASDVEDAVRLMGADYHAHGLEKNRHVVDVFCQAAFEDGLTRRRVTVDEFFADFIRA